jgi:hypothetical protein
LPATSRGRTGGENRLGLQGGDVLLRFPRGQLREQALQSVDGLDALPGQLLTPISEHPQRLQLDVIGQHPQPWGADRDHRDRVGVGLAVVAGFEQPRPGGELGWNVDHLLPVGQRPLRQGGPAPLLPSTAHTRSGQGATCLRIVA